MSHRPRQTSTHDKQRHGQLSVIWKSDLTDKMKRSYFQAVVMSILLYDHLPSITKTIQVRGTRLAGHSWKSRDELISDVLLWTPSHRWAKAGRQARTYIQHSVPIQDVSLKTYWRQWTKENGGEKGSEISGRMAWHDVSDQTHTHTHTHNAYIRVRVV